MPAGAYSGPIQLAAPFRQTVGVAAVQGNASGPFHGFIVKAICPGQTVYVGVASDLTTATGYPLGDGETLTLEIKNLNKLYFIASAAAQAIAVVPFLRASTV